ncbi:Gfo/Idh/MocA family oxidoreductase [Cecembia sp.]|uniref:Gfo/Idh/MocA family protein n=1 Tax=Cecembia sp. TaxID=1898110 RepID=UPI0025BAC98B|nr:Gfo/Idh/MocA family oxidoreductase [Cecembia sp.]
MNKKIGVGIIGTGAIAVKHAAAIKELEGAELLAVCSSTKERAKAAASVFGVESHSDIHSFLKHPRLDLITICTASGHHLEPALTSIAAGKHVLIEKPIEINLKRADQIIQAAREKGVKLGVIFQNRFNPDYLHLKNAIKEGQLGKLLMGNAYVNWFRDEDYYKSSPWKGTFNGDGGGALINQAIHTIDLLLDCLGAVQSVFGKTHTLYHEIETEDSAAAFIEFKNGALGTITASTAIFPGYPERLEIYGSKGSIILEGGKIKAWDILGKPSIAINPSVSNNSGASDPMAIGHQWHLEQYKDFLNAIQDDIAPLVSGEEGIKSLALIEGIYRSSKMGKMVFL